MKSVSKKPVLGVGRFTNPDLMVEAIEAGALDIIATCRPSISDPFLPKKIEEGRLDDIRECIGCNICISRWEIGGPPLICTQNATAGEEYRRGWHPGEFEPAKNADNDVLVVGAGPAGMECAMILGKRDMRRVHLVEAQDDMGGIMRWIPQLPGLGEWARVVNYRKIQIDKLKNVEFIPKTTLDAQGVKEYGAEIVVIATGGYWATDGLNGCTHDTIPGADAGLPWQLTPEQIMDEGKEVPGERVLILDNDGYFMGVSLAEKLAEEGKKVTLMTHLGHIAPYMHFTLEAPNMHRKLHKLGVEIVTYHMPTQFEEGSVAREPRLRRGGTGARVGGRRGRARDAAALERGALPRAEGLGGHRRARGGGHHGPLPDRRLRGAAPHRGLRLLRAPARARDRLGQPGGAPAVQARAARGRARGGSCVASMKVVVCVKQIGALGDEVEFTDDERDVDPDYLDYALNEWDSYATEEALRLARPPARARSSSSPRGRGRRGRDAARLAMGADRGIRVWRAETSPAPTRSRWPAPSRRSCARSRPTSSSAASSPRTRCRRRPGQRWPSSSGYRGWRS